MRPSNDAQTSLFKVSHARTLKRKEKYMHCKLSRYISEVYTKRDGSSAAISFGVNLHLFLQRMHGMYCAILRGLPNTWNTVLKS